MGKGRIRQWGCFSLNNIWIYLRQSVRTFKYTTWSDLPTCGRPTQLLSSHQSPPGTQTKRVPSLIPPCAGSVRRHLICWFVSAFRRDSLSSCSVSTQCGLPYTPHLFIDLKIRICSVFSNSDKWGKEQYQVCGPYWQLRNASLPCTQCKYTLYT